MTFEEVFESRRLLVVQSSNRPEQLRRLVTRLRGLPAETPWLEFKTNDAEPQAIGEYISALSNSAALEDRAHGYLVWGIEDRSHAMLGTRFRPHTSKRGGEDLIPWLTRLVVPSIHFIFEEVCVDGAPLVVLEVQAAHDRPTRFGGEEWIRIGSYKKKLKDYPDHERRLWKSFDAHAYETLTAMDNLTKAQLLELLDHEAYFRLLGLPSSDQPDSIVERLRVDQLVRWDIADEWSITHLGALLIARDLNAFPSLGRKSTRVISYAGTDRRSSSGELELRAGYASGFERLYDHVMSILPSGERYDTGIRERRPNYPPLVLRELIANMLVHQDLTVGGAGPTVELFDNRIEITNPGMPLIDKARFVDSPPVSRNEKLARALRQMGICEERGSGWDKIAFEVEVNQLPAPLIETTGAHTRVAVFSYKPFQSLTRDDRIRAIYLHSVLRYLEGKQTTNASVRHRFGLAQHQASAASRLLGEAVEQGLLAPHDREAGKRAMAYVPFWASQSPYEAVTTL